DARARARRPEPAPLPHLPRQPGEPQRTRAQDADRAFLRRGLPRLSRRASRGRGALVPGAARRRPQHRGLSPAPLTGPRGSRSDRSLEDCRMASLEEIESKQKAMQPLLEEIAREKDAARVQEKRKTVKEIGKQLEEAVGGEPLPETKAAIEQFRKEHLEE